MTNTVLRPAGSWLNPDGLLVRFGKEAQVDAVVGSPTHMGDDTLFIADIDYIRLPAFQSADTTGVIYGNYPNAAIPAGAYIKSAVLDVDDVAFAGATAVLTLGLVQADGTEIDNNGLFNITDGAVANLGLGTARAGTGALIGTKLATTGYLWASVTTASFTAGRGRLTVTYWMPAPATHDADGTLA